MLAAGLGPRVVYGIDAVSFAVSFALLWLLRPLPPPVPGEHGPALGLRSVAAGIRYARGRQELVGSYLADLAAMTFAYPNALFPFMASPCTRRGPWG